MRWPCHELNVWHTWFAWHPVDVGHRMVWLERVWRKDVGSYDVLYKYKLMEEGPDESP